MKKIIICLILIMAVFSLNVGASAEPIHDNFNDSEIKCGTDMHFSTTVVNISYYSILVFQVAAPIAIVVFGLFDLAKGVTAAKEEDMKKGRAQFLKRLISGVMVFFVITIAKIVLNVFANNGIMNCVNCFLNGAKACM